MCHDSHDQHLAGSWLFIFDRVALQLFYWFDWRNGAVGLERSKQRLLVAIGKVVAQSKSVSHMGRKNRQKTCFSARPWKDEVGNSNAVHQEVQNTNWEDWGIACRQWANCVGPFTNIVRPTRSKQDSRQAKTHVDNLLSQLVDDMHSTWNADSFLDRAQELVKKAIDEHAKYAIAGLDRSRPVKKGAATRRRLGEQVAHTRWAQASSER